MTTMIHIVMSYLFAALYLTSALSLLAVAWKAFVVSISGKELEGKHLRMSGRYYRVATAVWVACTFYTIIVAATNPDIVFERLTASAFFLATIYVGVLMDLMVGTAMRLEQRYITWRTQRYRSIPHWHPENEASS